MKKILSFLTLTTICAMQMNGQILMDTCRVHKKHMLNKVVRSVPDTSKPNDKLVYPDTTDNPLWNPVDWEGDFDEVPEISIYHVKQNRNQKDTSYLVKTCDGKTYEIIERDTLPSNASRPIYFLHGLGGKEDSWKKVQWAFDTIFNFRGYLSAYNRGEVYHQDNFKDASYEADRVIGAEASDFNMYYTYYDLPYVIAHSQGGLVARDLDWKYYDKNSDSRSLWGQRKFYGLATVGTPHSGAKIAISQADMTKLGTDIGKRLAKAQVARNLSLFTLKYPITRYIKTAELITKASVLIDTLNNVLASSLYKLASKGQADGITRQYGPNSSYLRDTLNKFVNPCLAKVLFYGIEQEDMIWRIATYMLKNSQYYPQFGANNDDTLHTAMENIRVRLIAKESQAKRNTDFFLARYRKCLDNSVFKYIQHGKHNGLYCSPEMNQARTQNRAALAYNDAHEFLAKANYLFKEILGAVGDDAFYDSLTHYVGNVNGSVEMVYAEHMTDSLLNAHSWIPRYTRFDTTFRSDATVLEHSQKAFPGCEKRYKHEMLNKDGAGNYNHMQERNCLGTKQMLLMIYNADGKDVPEFFKLRKWK
ncbi:MAG: hypothetical protein JJ975_02460 [Bacteroidia bacterium]|nr:hypothetical protein [Bacteroidia bacterium]